MEQFREKLNLKNTRWYDTWKKQTQEIFIASQKKCVTQKKKQLERKQQWIKIHDKI